MNTKFCELSSLVLVDILAALPMEHVVRMARLGHERLRYTASLRWVIDRMANVSFKTIVKAQQARGDAAKTFCTNAMIKRLYGRIVVSEFDSVNPKVASN